MPGIAEIEIPKHYVPMFKANLAYKPGYDGSILRPHVTVDTATGDGASPVQVFGRAKIRVKTDRYGDTPIDEIERFRPWVFPIELEGGTLIDNQDQVKSLIDPTSPITNAIRMEIDSQIDYKAIIPAFFGNRFEGKDVGTALQAAPIVFDPLNAASINLGSAGDATPIGMTVKKIKWGIRRFKQLKVIQGSVRREMIKVGLSSQQWDDLFEDVKAINGDYVNGRPIERGQLGMIMGVDFVELEDLPRTGTTRYCPMWVPSGISLLHWVEEQVNIGPDPGKRFNIRVYVKKMVGATRTMEEKVIQLPCLDNS